MATPWRPGLAGGWAGRRVLVEGASSGIGRAVVLALAARGARVAATARRSQLLEQLAAEAAGAVTSDDELEGVPVGTFPADVTAQSSHTGALAEALEWLGGVDALVYAAGSARLSPLTDGAVDDWYLQLATNVVGAAQAVATCLPVLREGAHPCVVLLSTHAVERPWPGLVGYAASKAALEALGRGLREEERRVRTVNLRVGPTLTSFADAWDPESAGEAMARWNELGHLEPRVLETREVAEVVIEALEGRTTEEITVLGERPSP